MVVRTARLQWHFQTAISGSAGCRKKKERTIMKQPKEIVEEFFAEIPKQNFDRIRQLMHSEYSYTGGDGEIHKGVDAGIAVGEMYTRAFPDLQLDITNMYVDGNKVITEFVGRGTHQGELEGIAPTGKKVQIPICNIIEIRDNKIYSEHEYWDSAVLMQQLGVQAKRQPAVA